MLLQRNRVNCLLRAIKRRGRRRFFGICGDETGLPEELRHFPESAVVRMRSLRSMQRLPMLQMMSKRVLRLKERRSLPMRRKKQQRERGAPPYVTHSPGDRYADFVSNAENDRGIEVREVAGGYRMGTKPEYHDAVRGFVKSLKPPLKLTLQALETLAVVATSSPDGGRDH